VNAGPDTERVPRAPGDARIRPDDSFADLIHRLRQGDADAARRIYDSAGPRHAAAPTVRLDKLVKPLTLRRPAERDTLVARVWPVRDKLMFDHRRGAVADLRGAFGAERGPGRVAEAGEPELMNYLAPLLDEFDSVAGFLFTHDGD
jgi:hypothetical protein